MDELAYSLTDDEKARLHTALEVAFTIPIVPDVEGFGWEAVFHYVKQIDLPDSIVKGRSKQLFDAVAPDGRAWSLKTLVKNDLTTSSNFEFVIQRADIFSKAIQLGFPQGLTAKSNPADLGVALIRHWNQKFQNDCSAQNVTDPRISILLKNKARKRLAYIEFAYSLLDEQEYTWRWAVGEKQRGLQGFKDGRVHFKWYPSGTQLFQVSQIPKAAYNFTLEWQRVTLSDFFEQANRTFTN